MNTKATCAICGDPMPKGEEMFKIHGYSCDCPKPPLHPSVRGERSAGDADILIALPKHATGDVGEDAYIRLYPADARRILDRLNAPERQRAAALKLADKWEAQASDARRSIETRFALSGYADQLRAIFAPKEGK